MRFSTRTEYGMRAMVFLAKNYGKKLVSLAVISRKEKISQAYLERLIAKLKANNLVESSKGVKGGYKLTKSPSNISLFEVVQVLEGPIALFNCLTGKMICYHKACLTKKVWLRLQNEMIKVLKQAKLSELF